MKTYVIGHRMVPIRVIPVEYIETEELCWIPDVIHEDHLSNCDGEGCEEDEDES